jgi:transposase-like protein
LALVVLSIVEQRLDAVRAVLAGVPLIEVAAGIGVHRATLHRWVSRYLADGLAGLSDRSHRPVSCPHQVATQTRELLRARPNPLTAEQARRLRGARKPDPRRGRAPSRSGCNAERPIPA